MGLLVKIKPGNSITRQYRNTRKTIALKAVNSGLALGLGANRAIKGDGLLTSMWGVLSCIYVKWTAESISALKALRPDYKAIVARAKSIKAQKNIIK